MQPENAQSRGVSAQSTADEISVELSSRRTGMSFQRTRLSAVFDFGTGSFVCSSPRALCLP